jgi:hypothetical protein
MMFSQAEATMVAATLTPCPTSVLQRVEVRLGCSREESEALWVELLKFLSLCTQSDQALAPSNAVDEIWHEMVLHTKDYARLCNEQLGRFVHHVPTASPEREAYERTLQQMQQHFGGVNRRFWPDGGAADCNSTCNQCGSYCSS